MFKIHFVLFCVLVYVFNADTFDLVTSEIKMTFNTTSGNVLSIIDVASSTDLLESGRKYFFKLYIDDSWVEHEDVTPDSFSSSSSKVTVRYTISGIPVTATFEVSGNDITCSLFVDNEGSGKIVEEVWFPTFKLKKTLPGGNERAYISRIDGVIVKGKGLDDFYVCDGYPGHISMQLYSFYNDDMGLGFEVRDSFMHPKHLGLEAGGGKAHIEMCNHFKFPYEPGHVIPEIPTVIFKTSKHWLKTTEHYKPWAQQQKWYLDALANPNPSWTVSDELLVIDSTLVPERCGYQVMPTGNIVNIMNEWKKVFETEKKSTDIRMMSLYRGFEKYGLYIGPFLTPFTDGRVNGKQSDLQTSFYWVNNQNHHPAAMIPAMKWHKSRKEQLYSASWYTPGFNGYVYYPPGSPNEKYSWNETQPNAEEVCVLKKDQSGCKLKSGSAGWIGIQTEICQGVSWKNQSENIGYQLTTEYCALLGEFGVDNFEIDQWRIGKIPCYNESHGHPRGYGNWSIVRSLNVFKECLRVGKEKNVQFTVSNEDVNELLLPYIGLAGCRTDRINTWPAADVSNVKNAQNEVERWSYPVPAFVSVYGKVTRCFNWDVVAKTGFPDHKDYNVHVFLERTAQMLVNAAILSVELDNDELVYWLAKPSPTWKATDPPYNSGDVNTIAQLPERMHGTQLEFLKNCVRSQYFVLKDYISKPDISLMEIASPSSTFMWQKAANFWSSPTYTKHLGEVLYGAFKKDSDPNIIASVFVNFDPQNTQTIGRMTKFDGSSIQDEHCFRVVKNGCKERVVKYKDISSTISVGRLEVVIYVFMNTTSCTTNVEEVDNCFHPKVIEEGGSSNGWVVTSFLLLFVMFVV